MKIVYANDTITPVEMVKFLSLTWQSQPIYREIIKRKESMKKAQELKIEISDEELQQFVDNFRSAQGLFSAEATLNFLNNAGLTEDDFEVFCEISLLAAALKDHLADEKKISEYFVNNRSEFDRARISIIVVKEENLANEIVMQVNEDGEDFHALAREHSLDGATKYSGGYAGLVSRTMLTPELGAKVLNAAAGDLLGPFQHDDFYQLILVE